MYCSFTNVIKTRGSLKKFDCGLSCSPPAAEYALHKDVSFDSLLPVLAEGILGRVDFSWYHH